MIMRLIRIFTYVGFISGVVSALLVYSFQESSAIVTLTVAILSPVILTVWIMRKHVGLWKSFGATWLTLFLYALGFVLVALLMPPIF